MKYVCKRSKINMNELEDLRANGFSRPRLAKHFGVSESTIKRLLQNDPVNQFANQLTFLVDDAPEGYCRNELKRLINDLRTYKTSTLEEKKSKVLTSLKSMACEIEEIADDCNLSEKEILDLLKDLENEKKIYTRVQSKRIRYFLIVK